MYPSLVVIYILTYSEITVSSAKIALVGFIQMYTAAYRKDLLRTHRELSVYKV